MPGEAIAQEKVRVFQCQSCKEYINTSMTECKFCGAAVDYNVAQVEGAVQSQTGNACSDASYLKIMSRVTVTVYLLSWLPIAGWLGIAFLVLMIIIPIMGIRWWVKYASIKTTDPDYKAARKSVLVAMIIWAALLVVWFVISIIYAFLVLSLSHR